MAHISGEAVRALLAITEVRASDDAIIALDFDGVGPAVRLVGEDGEPVRLWQLREMASAFKMWF